MTRLLAMGMAVVIVVGLAACGTSDPDAATGSDWAQNCAAGSGRPISTPFGMAPCDTPPNYGTGGRGGGGHR